VTLRTSLERLVAEYGPQHWWPANSPFEIMLGAVLVQQTTWRQAARAIDALGNAGLLNWSALANADPSEVEARVRPAGFYRAKAKRVIALAAFVAEVGGVAALNRLPTRELRGLLLAREGVGEETADAMLLYAFERPVCVIDAYLRRWYLRRHGIDRIDDRTLRAGVVKALPSVAQLNEFHALIVEHGKRRCKTRPLCDGCCLFSECSHGQASVA